MDSTLAGHSMPKFRDGVNYAFNPGGVEIALGERRCTFHFADSEGPAVSRLFEGLRAGGQTASALAATANEIAEHVPHLLEDFDGLRLLVESDPVHVPWACSGAQLYREVRRLADRTLARVAKSAFYNALVDGRVSRTQLIGYALEYYWIVQSAPGLIGPALATARSAAERTLMQDFLRSELGHDRFLAGALSAVGINQQELEHHQPLPTTLALCASLGVYGRQHPLSFKASLFLFERAQPEFIDAFDERCKELGLPEAFYAPLRAHAEINEDYDHEDISRSLMALEKAIDAENCTVVKRHIAIMLETMIEQEHQILTVYGRDRAPIPRIFS